MTDALQVSEEGAIGILTLSRPQALNALTLAMIQAMQQQLLRWQQDDKIHAVVIQSAGGKAFCAGGDVRWLYERGLAHDPEQLQFFWQEYRLNQFIHEFNKPYIALMDGITMGGGVGISLHGSHPVASERFIFAMPETSIGFFPDIGASYLLARCPGEIGPYLGLTGNRLNAADALFCGLVKQVVHAEHFSDLLSTLIKADLSGNAFAAVDHCIREYAVEKSEAAIADQSALINQCFAYDTVEAILSALTGRDALWAQETAALLLQKSPLALKVTLAQLLKARSLSMPECIEMDKCLVAHFMQDSDFYEGVRALLIDKDKTPKWQPDALENVSASSVAAYFKLMSELNVN